MIELEPTIRNASETSLQRLRQNRPGVRPPKFAGLFANLDFEAVPLPVLSLYPMPLPVSLDSLEIMVCGLDCRPRLIPWPECAELPRYRLRAPLICQIFNWAEEVEWEGVRLADFLEHAGLQMHPDGYLAVYSRDGTYFEGFSTDEVRDPRVLLATTLNRQPLPDAYGGPLRLVVPFLQGYKSVKWVGAIRATRHDPVGIKRLLGQSKTGRLGQAWLKRFVRIYPAKGRAGDP